MTVEPTPQQRWNARFATEDYIFGTAPNAFLVSQRDRLAPGMKALSIADGEGRNGVWLAEQGLDVVTVDFAPPAVEKAKRLAQQRGVTIDAHCAGLEDWDWGHERYDVVAAIFIQFAPPAMRDGIFRRMKEALKPGGLILMEGYRPEQLAYKTGGPSQVENLYTPDLLRTAFADMEILHLAAYVADVDEGSGHRGRSALIDMVARKPR